MSNADETAAEFKTDTLALNYITQAVSEVTGDRTEAEKRALQVSLSPRVMYAALCYIAESEPWETLVDAVRGALA